MSLSDNEKASKKTRKHTRTYPVGKKRLIDINEVCYRTSMAKSTVWAKVAVDEFVQPIKVKAGVTRWLESEIDAWIDNVIEASGKGAA